MAENSQWVLLDFVCGFLSGFLIFLTALFIGQVVWEVQLPPPPR